MNKQVQQGRADTGNQQTKGVWAGLGLLMCVFLLSFPFGLAAQVQPQAAEDAPVVGQEPAEEAEQLPVSLPDSHQMAMALATPGMRESALLDLATAAHLLNRVDSEPETDPAGLAKTYLDDRAWLQMLVDRYGWVQPYGPVLDPAAWLVLGELQQHDLEDIKLVLPGRNSKDQLIHQVFQRAEQKLATANLPVLLLEIEADVISLWNTLLQLVDTESPATAEWKAVEDALSIYQEVPQLPVEDSDSGDHEPQVRNIAQAMTSVVRGVVEARPPDNMELVQLRYSVLTDTPVEDLALPGEGATVSIAPENDPVQNHARDTLYLISMVDGLHDGRYFEFVRGVLSLTSNLLEHPALGDERFLLADWLAAELPAISAHFAVDFARFDPRLNTAMATAFEVLLDIAGSHGESPDPTVVDIKSSRMALADAVAQLALLIPDMGYYFDTPLRARIVEEINICISIAASQDDNGNPAITRRQFDACMGTLLELADQEARLAELSGDMNGPFTVDTLRRELTVMPWQRINYGIGYLHERYSTSCQLPASPMPNPLEWAVLATTLTWFAEHTPGFLQTPENEARLSRMRGIGEQLLRGLAEQAECLAGSGSPINDPVSRSMTEYELALRELEQGIEDAEADFRTRTLRPGADILLDQGALQETAYRPENLVIEACDSQTVCEMTGDLSVTRALIGLFSDEYLVAEQAGMGHLEICYRNMEWVQRRSELVRADDPNVANYYGHLGFDLVGRYVENDSASDIFDFRFTSPQEYHYLFAQTSDEVLSDGCPMEWVGSRIVTPLRENRGGIVPNRLTYLAASRKLPSRLLQNNWDNGAEWRDWFVTGIGVTPQEVPPVPAIETRLNQHLQSLYQAEQAEIYRQLLLPSARNAEGDQVSLFDEMSQVSIAKALVRVQMMLFYPDALASSDQVRMAITGEEGLIESRTLRRFREANVPLTSVNGIARERLEQLRRSWSKQPAAVRRQGSAHASLAWALTRINVLYREFFTSRPEPLQEIEVTAQPQVQQGSE